MNNNLEALNNYLFEELERLNDDESLNDEKQLEKDGKIKDLELQKEFILLDSFKLNGKSYRKTSYFADFTFKTTQGDKLHVVGIKSPITRKNGVYKLKKKLLANRYGIEIEEM